MDSTELEFQLEVMKRKLIESDVYSLELAVKVLKYYNKKLKTICEDNLFLIKYLKRLVYILFTFNVVQFILLLVL